MALRSADPFDPPLIDPGYVEFSSFCHSRNSPYFLSCRYLKEQNDIAMLVRGLKIMLKVVKTEPLSSVSPNQNFSRHDYYLEGASDEVLEEEVRKRAETLYHPTCTCRMARLEDDGVVDARLKVYGLENVRVVDASIFPRIVSGHTVSGCIVAVSQSFISTSPFFQTAPVYAVAEKAADIIKQAL